MITAACDAIYRLNRHAKTDRNIRSLVYDHKSRLIEYLYASGMCVAAYAQPRVHYGYDGYGYIESLVCMHFAVGDKRYCWHSPAARIQFAWQPTAPPAAWDEHYPTTVIHMTPAEIDDAIATIDAVLRLADAATAA